MEIKIAIINSVLAFENAKPIQHYFTFYCMTFEKKIKIPEKNDFLNSS